MTKNPVIFTDSAAQRLMRSAQYTEQTSGDNYLSSQGTALGTRVVQYNEFEGFLTSNLAVSSSKGTVPTTATMIAWQGVGAQWKSGIILTVTNRNDKFSALTGDYIRVREINGELRPFTGSAGINGESSSGAATCFDCSPLTCLPAEFDEYGEQIACSMPFVLGLNSGCLNCCGGKAGPGPFKLYRQYDADTGDLLNIWESPKFSCPLPGTYGGDTGGGDTPQCEYVWQPASPCSDYYTIWTCTANGCGEGVYCNLAVRYNVSDPGTPVDPPAGCDCGSPTDFTCTADTPFPGTNTQSCSGTPTGGSSWQTTGDPCPSGWTCGPAPSEDGDTDGETMFVDCIQTGGSGSGGLCHQPGTYDSGLAFWRYDSDTETATLVGLVGADTYGNGGTENIITSWILKGFTP